MTKTEKKISSNISRSIYSLSHYAFREKLLSRAKEAKNKIIITSEAYTSQTCTKCGNMKKDLKGNKEYKCEKCKNTIDRDINGARNIMIRLMTKSE